MSTGLTGGGPEVRPAPDEATAAHGGEEGSAGGGGGVASSVLRAVDHGLRMLDPEAHGKVLGMHLRQVEARRVRGAGHSCG